MIPLPALSRVDELIPRLLRDDRLAGARERLIRRAREEAAQPVVRRPRTLAELQASGIAMKYPEKPAHKSRLDHTAWEQSALALGDAAIGRQLSIALPRIALAAAFTGDPALFAFVRAQLAEIASWAPLQRPGAMLGNQKRVLPPGGDGAWLGTGWLIRTLVDTLETLPAAEVPAELRQAVRARLEAEIAALRDDWATQRPWYVKKGAAYCNQWVLPVEGLIRATLYAGPDRHREAFEAGVRDLLRSLDAQGAQGEFVEGLEYAGLTLLSVLSAAEAAARAGDDRIRAHPYLQKFPTWYVHHFQPGGVLINAFDSKVAGLEVEMLSQFAVVTGSREALWALRTRDGFADTLHGLVARTLPAETAAEPSLYANYPVAARLNWRESWDDDTAAGLWIRGGHASDAHDHMDRGHVDFSIGRRRVLLEAGLLSYGIPEHPTHFKSVAGHNVLQIGDEPPAALTPEWLEAGAGQILDPAHRAAPITVARLDATGGEVSLDASGCYATAALKRWVRSVSWDRRGVEVRDEVELPTPAIVLFRWHLGAAADAVPVITPGGLEIGGISLAYEADVPVRATIETMPDDTLRPHAIGRHACVVLRPVSPVTTFTLRTRIGLQD